MILRLVNSEFGYGVDYADRPQGSIVRVGVVPTDEERGRYFCGA